VLALAQLRQDEPFVVGAGRVLPFEEAGQVVLNREQLFRLGKEGLDLDVTRIELRGSTQCDDGLVNLPLRKQDQPEDGVRPEIVGGQRGGPTECGGGLVHLILPKQRHAEGLLSADIVRVPLEDRACGGDSSACWTL
jgi:hypothetical protein